MEVEHGRFTPLVMSATRGMGRTCEKFYSCSAEMIRSKKATIYSIASAWIRGKILFSFMKSIGICLHDSRSTFCSIPLEQSLNRDAYVSESIWNV